MEPACPLDSTLASLPANFALRTAPWGCSEAATYSVLDAPSKPERRALLRNFHLRQQLPCSLRVKYPAQTLPSPCSVGSPTPCWERRPVGPGLPLSAWVGEVKARACPPARHLQTGWLYSAHPTLGLAGPREGAEQGAGEDVASSRKLRMEKTHWTSET